MGIIAPASDIKADLLQQGCEALKRLGYHPFYFESILERDLYFAGGRERRLRELHDVMKDDGSDAAKRAGRLNGSSRCTRLDPAGIPPLRI